MSKIYLGNTNLLDTNKLGGNTTFVYVKTPATVTYCRIEGSDGVIYHDGTMVHSNITALLIFEVPIGITLKFYDTRNVIITTYKVEECGIRFINPIYPAGSQYVFAYIQGISGLLYTAEAWGQSQESPNGIAVVDNNNNFRFVIGLNPKQCEYWGPADCNISGMPEYYNSDSISYSDANGQLYTLSGVDYISTNHPNIPSDFYAISYCYNYTFPNGLKGYLGTVAQMVSVVNNYMLIDECLKLLGVSFTIESSTFWTCCLNGWSNAWVASRGVTSGSFDVSRGPNYYIKALPLTSLEL